MSFIAATPETPYYAVIFSSIQSDDLSGYGDMAARMESLARQQEGFLGIESARAGKKGITVSYWKTTEAMRKWKANLEHLEAQALGKKKFYDRYRVRVVKVEREYGR